MEDIRSLKRRHLIYYLDVFNNKNNELLGKLVDITTRGIKLVSRLPVPIDKDYSLRLTFPEGYFRSRDLTFDARSIWSSNDINPDFYDTGFEVINLDREGRKIIRRLIELVGFNDSNSHVSVS